MIEPCNNTSVGIIVRSGVDILLIERAKLPYAWAPPAGHIDGGESPFQAAVRELREEVGLDSEDLIPVLSLTFRNKCRRPGGDFHHWNVFETSWSGQEPICSKDEIKAVEWASPARLKELGELSRSLLQREAAPGEWRSTPGLEPVWMDILERTDL